MTAVGPYDDFHIKPTLKGMTYIGGGAGMTPLRAHLSQLFDTDKTHRKVSYWYGARSRQEIFYDDYFESLAIQHENFSFHLALSEPQPEDNWQGHTGCIHEIVLENYLQSHPSPKNLEYYLCGPPMMIKACKSIFDELDVPNDEVTFDAF